MTRRTVSHWKWIWRALTLVLASIAATASAENSAIVPVVHDSAHSLQRHNAMSERLKTGHAKVLWIGDSIVERFDGPGKSTWDKYYAPRDAVNLGIGGDRTEHVLWRLDHCNLECVSPKLAIVMIGQNNGPHNSAEEIADGTWAIVAKLRERFPEMKVLLLGIFFRGEKPNDEQIKLGKTNDILSQKADGQHVVYININKIFMAPDGTIIKSIMPDFEHPNAEGCRIWAEAIEPKVAELLGETPIKP